MFRLGIAAVGRDRASPLTSLTDEYISRARPLGRGLGIEGPDLRVVEAPKGLRDAERQAKEADLLLNAIPDGDGLILLDERGKNLKSRELTARIETIRDTGAPGVWFVLGGADGFGAALGRDHPRVQGQISFGAATWPHLLCRVMLAEQLYRAMTIMAGHPYHRD